MHRSSFRAVALAMALAFGEVGCGGAKDKPVPVEGVVLLDGQPLAGATVLFSPLDSKGQGAYGLTDDKGSFRLACQNGLEGALPGEYKVVITRADSQQMAPPADESEAARMADKMMRANVGKKRGPPRKAPPSILPAEYSDEKKTTLRATVPPPDGKVTLNLQSHKSR